MDALPVDADALGRRRLREVHCAVDAHVLADDVARDVAPQRVPDPGSEHRVLLQALDLSVAERRVLEALGLARRRVVPRAGLARAHRHHHARVVRAGAQHQLVDPSAERLDVGQRRAPAQKQ
jgi:hypothetical protein